MKCKLCNANIINAIAYQNKNKIYICIRCYSDLEEVMVTDGKVQKDGEFIDFIK